MHATTHAADITAPHEPSTTAVRKPRISLFFPVYKDEGTVGRVAEKSVALLADVADAYEIIIIDDGSPDRAGEVAEEFARTLCRRGRAARRITDLLKTALIVPIVAACATTSVASRT